MTAFARWTLLALLLGLTLTAQAEDAETQLFDQLDKNKDGVVAADEVSEAQSQAFQRLLRIGDNNEDGQLSREEYTKTLAEPQPVAQPQPAPNPGGPGRGEPGEMFKRLDRNGDGKVALEELPEELREKLKPAFERFGKDALTREEFARLAAMRGNQAPGKPQPGALGAEFVQKALQQHDKNGDKQLSRDEAPERMKQRFDRIDANKDGFVNEQELTAVMQKLQRNAANPDNSEKPKRQRRSEKKPE